MTTILPELGQELGLGSLELNEFGLCQLVFDEELAVDIQVPKEDEAAFFTAVLCRASEVGGESLFRTLLEANFMGQGTGNACFAVDAALDEIVLVQRLELDVIDTARFKHELELFVDVLAAWRQRLREEGTSSEGTPAEGEAAPALHSEGFLRA